MIFGILITLMLDSAVKMRGEFRILISSLRAFYYREYEAEYDFRLPVQIPNSSLLS